MLLVFTEVTIFMAYLQGDRVLLAAEFNPDPGKKKLMQNKDLLSKLPESPLVGLPHP